MTILLADPDRDLLSAYKKLFELDSHSVTAVFDGPLAVTHLVEQRYDLVILSSNIPEIDCKYIVKMMNKVNIPVIVLLEKRVTPQILIDSVAASSYLSLPFLPGELRERAEEVVEKAASNKTLTIDGVEIEIANFCSTDGTRFTNEEINILTALTQGRQFDVRRVNSYINVLNNKFERLGKSTRIKYVMNEGYRLVKNNE